MSTHLNPQECVERLRLVQELVADSEDPDLEKSMNRKILRRADTMGLLVLANQVDLDIDQALVELIIPKIPQLIEQKQPAAPKRVAPKVAAPKAPQKNEWTTVASLRPRRAAAKRQVTSRPWLTGMVQCKYPERLDMFLHRVMVNGVSTGEGPNGIPNGIPIGWIAKGGGWFEHIRDALVKSKYNPADRAFTTHMAWDKAKQKYVNLSHADFLAQYDHRKHA